jgi:hypothetical protein
MTVELNAHKELLKLQLFQESLREDLSPKETLHLLKEIVSNLKEVLDQLPEDPESIFLQE